MWRSPLSPSAGIASYCKRKIILCLLVLVALKGTRSIVKGCFTEQEMHIAKCK